MKTELKKEEKIIIETKVHWITLVFPSIITFLSLLLGIVAGQFGYYIAILCFVYLIYKIIERKNNIWIVTNFRVVDEYGVLSSNSKESPLDKINNVSYNQSLFGKMFGYGNVQIQTAAEVGSTTYLSVENPKELKDTITKMQEEYKHNQITKQASELAKAIVTGQQNNSNDISSQIEKLHELKQKGILTEEEYNNRKAKILNS